MRSRGYVIALDMDAPVAPAKPSPIDRMRWFEPEEPLDFSTCSRTLWWSSKASCRKTVSRRGQNWNVGTNELRYVDCAHIWVDVIYFHMKKRVVVQRRIWLTCSHSALPPRFVEWQGDWVSANDVAPAIPTLFWNPTKLALVWRADEADRRVSRSEPRQTPYYEVTIEQSIIPADSLLKYSAHSITCDNIHERRFIAGNIELQSISVSVS